MDPMQLQLMQQMGMGQVPGIPGMQAPLSSGGASQLAMMSQLGIGPYAPSIAGNPFPDVSPLAPIQPQLQQFGMIGMLGGIAGNGYLTSMLEKNGVLPMGNAGSYMQAYQAREFQKMRHEVGKQVAGQDAEGFYRTFRGMAALADVPFNQEQREAAHRLANTVAEYGPMLAMAAPGLLDAFAGERGSVQAMSAQMMEANRYRVDPTTGRMGYGTEANADLVNNVFENMFAGDNVAKMQGMRAGDMGQLYRRLSGEGLAGPRGSLQDRTLLALNAARDAGELDAVGTEAGVNVSGNLAALSNDELTKLRQNNSVRQRMSDADARQVSDQLQDYVGTLSALREVFGENGNPNAPIPQLINALESLTSGQMHKFDASRLNMMVRDMQSLSQMSGKSVDQILAMNQTAAAQGQQFGLGTTFAPTATNVALQTGMAFQQEGGATGFGALDRQGAEQAAMNLFNRGMASEMSNTLGALGRIEEAGGFADNPAGDRMRAVMAAARAGESTYIDPVTKTERRMPTKEAEFRSLITDGAVPGMNQSSFNMMLGDRTSNLRFMHYDPELQQAAFNNQFADIERRRARTVGNRLSSEKALMDSGLDNRGRNFAAQAMGEAATAALADLSPQERQSAKVRNRAIADALILEAGNHGVELDDKQALTMAAGAYGQMENVARGFGFESDTAYGQTMGKQVSAVRVKRAAQARARAGINQAMSRMGPSGGIMERFFTAVQKQGDRGGEADLDTVMQDMFGADMDQAKERLRPELKDVADQNKELNRLEAELETATPERRRELQREIEQKTIKLEASVDALRDTGQSMGIGGGEEVFDREDISRAQNASRDLKHFNRIDQVRLAAAESTVSSAELVASADSKFTTADAVALGAERRNKELAKIDGLKIADVDAYGRAMSKAKSLTVGDIGSLSVEAKEVYAKTLAATSDTFSGGDKEAALAATKEYLVSEASSLYDPTDDDDAYGRAMSKAENLTVGDIDNLSVEARAVYDQKLAATSDTFIGGNEEAALAATKKYLVSEASSLSNLTDDAREVYERTKARNGEDTALKRTKRYLRDNLGTTEDYAAYEASEYRDMTLGDLTPEQQKTIIQQRRANSSIVPTEKQVKERMSTLREMIQLPADANMTAEERLNFTRTAEDQLTAENQLRALGQLSEDETLVDSSEFKNYDNLGTGRYKGLKQQLMDAKTEDRAGIVSKYLDQMQLEKFYGDENEVDQNRVAAITALGTAEGRQAKADIETNIETMIDTRRAFLLDDGAVSRLGAARSVAAVERSREATDNLQTIADSYYNGSKGQALSLGGVGMDAQGARRAEEDFKAATPEERKAAAARLSQEDPEVKAENLTASHYKAYISLKARDYTEEITTANDEMAGAVDKSLLAKDMGVTEPQLEALQKLASMEVDDVGEDAEKLGMTEDKYRATMRGGEIDENLKLFTGVVDGRTPAQQLAEAKDDAQQLKHLPARLEKIQADRQTDAGKDSKSLAEEEKRLTDQIGIRQDRQNKRMEAAGLDPSKAEDGKTYNTRLSNQRALQKLEKTREEYMAQRQVLRDQNMPEAQIDAKLGSMQKKEEEAQKTLADLRESELSYTDLERELGEAFGLDTTKVSDELTAFQKNIGDGGAGAKHTQAMVVKALDKVDKLDIGDATFTAIEKLDMLTDQYAEAKTPKEREALAAKHGMREKDLTKMMKQTSFMELREHAQGKYGAEEYMSASDKVRGLDIAAEVKAEEERQMTLTGTVNITGVVNGEGTFDNVHGTTVR